MQTIIKNGKPYVMVPQSVYQNMMEQLEDSDDDIALTKALARGEEGFPLALFDAIDAGTNPVRMFRAYRGLTQQQLADAAGIQRPLLSDIENGKKSGSITTVKALARALNVPLDMVA